MEHACSLDGGKAVVLGAVCSSQTCHAGAEESV